MEAKNPAPVDLKWSNPIVKASAGYKGGGTPRRVKASKKSFTFRLREVKS
jgi:hypothetical protein